MKHLSLFESHNTPFLIYRVDSNPEITSSDVVKAVHAVYDQEFLGFRGTNRIADTEFKIKVDYLGGIFDRARVRFEIISGDFNEIKSELDYVTGKYWYDYDMKSNITLSVDHYHKGE